MITHAQQMPYRRLRPVERQPMREWLLDLLDSNEVASLTWLDRGKQEFKIKWCHGSRHGWSIKDADLFERWAKHTGRYLFGGKKDPKRWKANFRCALNSVKTIEEVRDRSQVKGSNAARIYRMKDGSAVGRQGCRSAGSKPKAAVVAASHRAPKVEEQHYNHTIDARCQQEIKVEESHKEEPYVSTANFMTPPPVLPVQNEVVPTVPETKTAPADSCLPNFDKISPGIDKIEFGKMHSIPKHSCGFTVQNLLSSSSSYNPSISNSISSTKSIITNNSNSSTVSNVNVGVGNSNNVDSNGSVGSCYEASSSSLGSIRILLPESFQALIAGVGTVTSSAPPLSLPAPLPQQQQQTYQPPQKHYVLPESPEASDASPQSMTQDEEMVEVSLVEVSEEVTLSVQGDMVEMPRGPLTDLSPLQWQPLQPRQQADLLQLLNSASATPNLATTDNLAITHNLATTTYISAHNTTADNTLAPITAVNTLPHIADTFTRTVADNSFTPITTINNPTTNGWSHSYSPLTPP